MDPPDGLGITFANLYCHSQNTWMCGKTASKIGLKKWNGSSFILVSEIDANGSGRYEFVIFPGDAAIISVLFTDGSVTDAQNLGQWVKNTNCGQNQVTNTTTRNGVPVLTWSPSG